MNNFTYEQIQAIRDSSTEKLLDYINNFVDNKTSLNFQDFYYPDFDKRNTTIAFNFWISIDYKTNSNKSFIEHMLEESPDKLSDLEKDVLIERNKSHISLFEIISIKGDHVEVMDLLTGKNHSLFEPTSVSILKPKNLIFGRIGKVISHKSFIGNLSFLPPIVKSDFLEEVFLDYNYTRIKNPELLIEQYLKEYSAHIYKTYTESVYNVLQEDEDSTSILYNELEEFENYLSVQFTMTKVKKHITNLINIYEYYLMKDDLTLYNLDEVCIKDLLDTAIKDNLIHSHSKLNSYISTIKIYTKFLKSISSDYNKVYNDILKISKNRFIYMNSIEYPKPYFKINNDLSNRISDLFNKDVFDFITDYEKFILYIMGNPLEVTSKRKNIKRKSLLYINKIMTNSEIIEKKAPNQSDFLLINLFYNFSLDMKIIKINKDILTVTQKSSHFIKLSDEEKFSLFIEYVWKDIIKDDKYNILDTLSSLNTNTFYKYEDILSINIKEAKDILNVFKHSDIMGLFEHKLQPYFGLNISKFGNMVFLILTDKDYILNDYGKVISLKQFNKSK